MTRLLLLGALLLGASVLACNGGSTPVAPTPTLSPPPISPALRALGEGSLTLELPAGGHESFEPLTIAQRFGTPPACADLVFLFRWRAGGEVRLEGDLRGATVEVDAGREGVASVGCMEVRALNPGRQPVLLELRYFVAEAR